MLKPTSGISSLIGIPKDMLSWTVNTNWFPKTISPIIKVIAKKNTIRLLSKYLEIIVF